MHTLTALIIDDEKHGREGLAALLELYCPLVQIAGDAGQMEQGISLIQEHQPDVVFLDIDMGDHNGFQLLDQLPNISFQLIFTTAHSDFAIKVFRYHAIDYLLKPIQPQQLIAAVEKASYVIQSQKLQHQLDALRRNRPTARHEKIIVPSMEGLHVINIDTIIHVLGSANYSTFYLDNGDKIMASKHLKYYETLLPAHLFFRSHQSHLVNIRYIKKIGTLEGLVIELGEGAHIPLARRRKEDLLALLKGM